MKDVYTFPAIFEPYKGSIGITFPDLPGCTSQTRDDEEPTYEHAMDMAREALALHLIAMEDDGDQIPEPTPLNQIEIQPGEAVVIVEVVLPLYQQRFDNDLARTNVTLPKWLKEFAQSKGVNLSKVLTDGLYLTLGLKKRPF
ncbi:MAG: type II toxin-antitoxin system HicB family antitoxin [Bacillota bacterium]